MFIPFSEERSQMKGTTVFEIRCSLILTDVILFERYYYIIVPLTPLFSLPSVVHLLDFLLKLVP